MCEASCRQLQMLKFKLLTTKQFSFSKREKGKLLSCRQLIVINNNIFDHFSSVWECLA